MNLEDRISKLEKSNKRFKVALALCLCMFMVSAKDIFIKDEIRVKNLYVNNIEVDSIKIKDNMYSDGIIHCWILKSSTVETVVLKSNQGNIRDLTTTTFYCGDCKK